MRTFYFFLSFMIMTSSFAQVISDEITCEVINQTKSFPKAIKIRGLNSERPSSDIQDAGLLFKKSADGVITIGFSNECDNYYEIELKRIKSGKLIGHIKGHSSDYMSEMIEKYDADFTEELGESSPLICR